MLDENVINNKKQDFLASNNYLVSFLIILISLAFGAIYANNNFFSNNLVDTYTYFDGLTINRDDFYEIGSGGQLYTFNDKKFDRNFSGAMMVFSGNDLIKNKMPGEVVYMFTNVTSGSAIITFVIQKSGKDWFFISNITDREYNKPLLHSFFRKFDKKFELFISKEELSLLDGNGSSGFLSQYIREKYIALLVKNGFNGFVSLPFSGSVATFSRSGYVYDVDQIQAYDTLDYLIQDQIKDLFVGGKLHTGKGILFIPHVPLTGVYLFKSKRDLEKLGYKVVSSRSRINQDAPYRRHNIATAFKKIGNVRIINPGEQLSFMDSIDFDIKEKNNYKFGMTFTGTNRGTAYGGGVCGASTAIYQGIITNKALKMIRRSPHSKWVSSFYQANINYRYEEMPGTDSTVAYKGSDFVFKNNTNHPIILFLQYDGEVGGLEDVFSLGFEKDKGSLVYKKKFVKGSQTCYLWNVNGNDVSSCYRALE